MVAEGYQNIGDQQLTFIAIFKGKHAAGSVSTLGYLISHAADVLAQISIHAPSSDK